METVIILSVVGILLVGCWHAGTVLQKHWKQLETDPESVVLIERKWDWAIWGPFLIAIVVITWVAPIWIGYVVAAYLFYWAVDWIWFRYVDLYIASATRGNRGRRIEPDESRRGPPGAGTRCHGPGHGVHSDPREVDMTRRLLIAAGAPALVAGPMTKHLVRHSRRKAK